MDNKRSLSWRCLCDSDNKRLHEPRVGHTAHTWDSNESCTQPRILLFGGANQVSTLNQSYALDIGLEEWTPLALPSTLPFPGMSRYEHSSALLASKAVLIFGGATQTGPLKDMFRLDISEEQAVSTVDKCSTFRLTVKSNPHEIPAFEGEPRTQHTCACITEYDQLLIFAGGGIGSQPIEDDCVHIYDSVENGWSVVSACGTPPSPRLGHLALYQPPNGSLKSSVSRQPRGIFYVHGGMSGDEFFDDFHILKFTNTDTHRITASWDRVSNKSDVGSVETIPRRGNRIYRTLLDFSGSSPMKNAPCARAAHGGACLFNPSNEMETDVYIFGGVSIYGALNDLHCFNTATKQWVEIQLDGLLPQPRFDFAYCIYMQLDNELKLTKSEEYAAENEAIDFSDRKVYHTFLFIHGGMDVEGNIFKDTWIVPLKEVVEPSLCY